MGVFSDNITRLAEYGLYTIPCGDQKQPILGKEWQNYCTVPPTEDEISRWEKAFKGAERTGLLLGPSTGIVAFDFDYEYEERKVSITEKQFALDKKNIEKEILRILPPSPSEKVGKKGWTKFYRYNPKLDNLACDRNGVRLFDFLVINKQTLIPPSLHSPGVDGKMITYRWTGTPLENCMDDIPEIHMDTITELKYMLTDVGTSHLGGRHGALFMWIVKMSNFERDVGKLSELAVRKDLELHKDRPYFTDAEYFRGKPFDNAKTLVLRILKWKSSRPQYQKNIADVSRLSRTSFESFEFFFDKDLNGAVREKLTGRFLSKDHNGMWQPVISDIKSIKSRAHTFGVDHSFTENHLAEYEKHKPLKLLIEPPKWDGVDRMVKIFTHLKFKNDSDVVSMDTAWDLFKEWCANIFRRIEDPMNQNRILIFRGPQGIGKDHFIKTVIGKALGHYFINLEPKDKNIENFIAIHGKMLCNISEFDETNKMTLSSVKNLITTDTQTLRLPYEPAAKEYIFHCTFFSSCNFESILRDPSGNRRFCIFDIEAINHGYSTLVLGHEQQLLAEMHQWYLDGHFASKQSHAELKRVIDLETPENPSELALELIVEIVGGIENRKDSFGQKVSYKDIESEILSLSRSIGISVFRLQQLMKRHKIQDRNGKERFYTTKNIKNKSLQ